MPGPQPQYIITPWRNPVDLLAVRASLYDPADPEDHALGLARIQAWKLRGNLPHVVESTGLLFSAAKFHNATIDAQTRDALGTDGSGVPADSFAIRATYTLALSRFVTGFADLGRHRAGAGQTMQDVAREIGLPATFVEIRHEATHEDIPTLGRLQKMTTEALGWLWQTYWSRLDDMPRGDENVDAGSQSDKRSRDSKKQVARTRDELKAFRTRRVAAIADGKSSRAKATMRDDVQKTAKSCVAAVAEGALAVDDIARLLVTDRLIVPSKVDSSAIASQAKGASLVWGDLLLALSERLPDFVQCTLKMAVEQLSFLETAEGTDPRIIFESWVLDMCTAPAWRAAVPDLEAVRWTLSACCLCPGPISGRLAMRLLSAPDIADSDIDQIWRPLLEASTIRDEEISTGASLSTSQAPIGRFVDDGQRISGWRLDERRCWSPLPIGLVGN